MNLTKIMKHGQRLFDHEIVVNPKSESVIQKSVRAAFNRPSKLKPVIIGYERIHLKWVR